MKVEHLIIHCSATPEGKNYDKKFFDLVHKSPPPVGRGWRKYGYNDVIDINGKIIELEASNYDIIMSSTEIANGVAGINAKSIHVCYIGGMTKDGKQPKNTMNEIQELALIFYIMRCLWHNPKILISGHNQWSNKACPSFDVPKFLKQIGINQANINKQKIIGL